MRLLVFSAILTNLYAMGFASTVVSTETLSAVSTSTPTLDASTTTAPAETPHIISTGVPIGISTTATANVSTTISTEALTTTSITTSATLSTTSSTAAPTVVSTSVPTIVPTAKPTALPMSVSPTTSTVEVDKYDSMTNYSALISTVVVYLDKCSKAKLNQYEWRIWEGNYSIRSYIQPIATIVVTRAVDEHFTMDPTTFIERASVASAKIGGDIICYITFKKNSYTFGFESMTFRAYRQVFLSGNKAWEDFYNERITKESPITNQQIRNEFTK